MSAWLKAALMLLGAGCVLLLAGAFPLAGAPAVYRGGAMLVAGALPGLLCLYGGWKLSSGMRARFLGGLACVFFAATGVSGVVFFGRQGLVNAQMGGAMWFGALAMFCLATVGLLFLCVFGFLAWRAMYRRLWLAAVHWALALMVVGAFMDYLYEVTAPVRVVPGRGQAVTEVVADGGTLPLGFSLDVEKFDISYYPEETYTLYRYDEGRWNAAGKPVREGDALVLGGRRWDVSALRLAPEMPRPFLLQEDGGKMELLMQDSRTVLDYCAVCRVVSEHRGREESRTVEIRVNEPLSFKGWVIHLQSWRPMGKDILVEFTARRAPGRLAVLGGMVGLIITVACWCWKRRDEEPDKPQGGEKQTESAVA